MRRFHCRTALLCAAAVGLGAICEAAIAVDDVSVERGVAYGEAGGEPLLLDVYRPADDGPSGQKRPAVLLIHGGGWMQGSRTAPSMVEIAEGLAQAGYVAFSIDYRLVKDSPDGSKILNQYPAAIDDCRRAVRWVRQHATEYGIDATRLGACGDSAGGHLVSMLGTSDAKSDDSELGRHSARVQAVIDIFGPVDLTQDFSEFEVFNLNVQDLIDRFLGKGNAQAQQEASPLLHIDDKSAAFLIFHGSDDPLVPVQQSRDFHKALKKAGRPSIYVEFPKQGHGFRPESRKHVVQMTVGFFDEYLKRRKNDGQASSPAKSQAKPTEPAPDWGALFRAHYVNRVRSFKEQNQVYRNVVLVGDSITEGFDVPTWFPGRRVLNRGIGADVIGNDMPADDPRGVLQRLDESFFDCAATDVFLLIGINDLNSGRKPDQLEAGYRELFQKIKAGAPRLRVHVQSVLPTRGAHAGRNGDVVEINSRLKEIAKEFGYDYIDLHSLMIDEKGELKADYTKDGLHLTAPAYAVWQAEIARVLGWDQAVQELREKQTASP